MSRRVFVLVHSPVVGPSVWTPVARQIEQRGYPVLVPDLQQDEASAMPFWMQHALSAAESIAEVPRGVGLILVGHSGAGPILPAIQYASKRPAAGYVFVDAGLPVGGAPRESEPGLSQLLDEVYVRGERFPNWPESALRDEVPDPDLRRELHGGLRPQPRAYWQEPLPVVMSWPDAPCAYLHFSAAYDAHAAEARNRGWGYLRLPGGHFYMLKDPSAVADALVSLSRGF